jgi:anti-sigma regulatory factor (Ser/Thr protein kinase)/anti-anti-sigma regulatory factor
MTIPKPGPAGGRFSVEVVRHLPVTLVAPRGRLDLATAGDLRETLIKGLTDCPEAVVVDLSGLWVDNDLPLSVFRVIRRHAASWPTIPVVLAAPSPDLADRLMRIGLAGSMPLYRDVTEAIAGAAGPPTRARADWDLLPGPGAPSEARGLATRMCQAWDLEEILDTVLIVMSELVTNAVVHGTGSVHVTVVLRYQHLHLVVRDQSPDPPRRAQHPQRHSTGVSLDSNGRGLHLLDAVCQSWGYLSSGLGKAVWARIRLPQTRLGSERSGVRV